MTIIAVAGRGCVVEVDLVDGGRTRRAGSGRLGAGRLVDMVPQHPKPIGSRTAEVPSDSAHVVALLRLPVQYPREHSMTTLRPPVDPVIVLCGLGRQPGGATADPRCPGRRSPR